MRVAMREDRGQQMCMLFMFNRACKVWEVWGAMRVAVRQDRGQQMCMLFMFNRACKVWEVWHRAEGG